MKKIFVLFIILFCFCIKNTNAQSIEINPQFGYTFRSVYYDGGGRIVFNSNYTYGGSLFFKQDKYSDAGITFSHMETTADAYTYRKDTFGVKVGITQYHVSVLRNFYPFTTDKLIPFAGGDLGASHFYAKNGGQSRLKASFCVKGGLKIQISDIISIKLQGQLSCPISGIGLGFGFGSGGASVGASAYASFIQFTASGGLCINIGDVFKTNNPAKKTLTQ